MACLLLGLTGEALAQQLPALIPYVNKERKWGYADTTGKLIVACTYSRAMPFKNGYGAVESGDKWGMINLKGRQIVAPAYTTIEADADGIIRARKGAQWFYMDAAGKRIGSMALIMAGSFQNGLAMVKDTNNLYGFMDAGGRMPIPAKYEAITSFNSKGRAAAKLPGSENWIIINNKNKELARTEATFVGEFVRDVAPYRKGMMWGLMDAAGKQLTPPVYEEIQQNPGTLWAYKSNGKYGFMNDEGKVMIAPAYTVSMGFDKKYPVAVVGNYTSSQVYGMIDEKGRVIIPLNYLTITPISEGYFGLTDFVGRYALANTSGKITTEHLFSALREMHRGVIPARDAMEQWMLVDPYGKVIVENTAYIGAGSEGFFPAGDGLRFGYLDAKGNHAIEWVYTYITDFTNGVARVERNARAFYIDRHGKEYIEW